MNSTAATATEFPVLMCREDDEMDQVEAFSDDEMTEFMCDGYVEM